jgi:DNA-binding HxlR family transcriptional regulator
MRSGRNKRRRSKYDIWASVLDLLIEGEKTLNGLRDATRLNQQRLKHHLDDLAALGLV